MEQCRDCDGGFYCDVEAATNYTAECFAGYYCESGVDRGNPNNAEVNSTYPPDCPLTGGHTGEKNSKWLISVKALNFIMMTYLFTYVICRLW